MAKTSSPPVPAAPVSYEAALQELETLVARLESGQLPLDQLLTGYQRFKLFKGGVVTCRRGGYGGG